METFATAAIALYAAHHVGDYWIQTDTQARRKGEAGQIGRLYCLEHVLTYLITAVALLFITSAVTGLNYGMPQFLSALAISGVTHYLADRREHGLMFWIARRMPGKARFMELGVPRNVHVQCDERCVHTLDNPQLATGPWALDQAWHIFWGVFVAALVLSV
jgi:uncharacterized protein DUF3307